MRWFRFYDDAFNNPKVAGLPAVLFRHWVHVLCIASKNGGKLGTIGELSGTFRVKKGKAVRDILDLINRGLIDQVEGQLTPHNWLKFQYKSDRSNERVKAHRERKCNVTTPLRVTAPETDTDTERKKEVCASHTQRARAKAATQIVSNWMLSEQGVEYARSKGWSDQRIADEAERFRDSAVKHGRSYRDWEAAWRNWVTSPYQAPAPPRQAAQVMSFKERKQKEWDDVRQRLREYADEPEGGRENGRAPVGLFPKALG